ncbi:MAG: hypothetical protein JW762_12690 [Dehalococcoidales bacterium]|nr:hypothetical protein [Dehalococcoidales bacterium]
MNEIWNTRAQALDSFETDLRVEASLIYQAFTLINEILSVFYLEDTIFCRVCGLTLLKARNLAQGTFSLALEGLAQEAGALLRPTIECLELLAYFSDDISRVNKALDEKLPSAGDISKCIQGKYQQLRGYLNKHASHFSFSYESMSHLIDFTSGNWKTTQPYNREVLRTNMKILFAILIQLLYQSANCLDCHDLLTISLEDCLNAIKKKGDVLFAGIPPA